MRHVAALLAIVLVVGFAVSSAAAQQSDYRVHIGRTAEILPTTQLRVTVSYSCPANAGLAFIYGTVVQDPQQAITTSLQGVSCTGDVETVPLVLDAGAFPWQAGRAMAAVSVFAAGATQDVEYRKIHINA